MKRSSLRRKTPLRPASPRPKPALPGADPAWDEWEALREAVHTRAGARCEVGVTRQCVERDRVFIRTGGHQAHHRKLRSQGGLDAVENLLAVCGYCHEWVHAHPSVAQLNGWIVPRHADPAIRGVVLHDRRLVLLDPDGSYVELLDPPEEGTPA